MNVSTHHSNQQAASGSPAFAVLIDMKPGERMDWLAGFRAFFDDHDITAGPDTSMWAEGWVAASEEVIFITETMLAPEDAVAPYGERGFGFGAWRHLFVSHGLLDALRAECAPAGQLPI